MTIYRFFDFHDRFNYWVDTDEPGDDFRFWVMAWLWKLCDDPHVDAAPADGLGAPWWVCKVPLAENETLGVVCLYSVEKDVVRCSGFSTLSKPII